MISGDATNHGITLDRNRKRYKEIEKKSAYL